MEADIVKKLCHPCIFSSKVMAISPATIMTGLDFLVVVALLLKLCSEWAKGQFTQPVGPTGEGFSQHMCLGAIKQDFKFEASLAMTKSDTALKLHFMHVWVASYISLRRKRMMLSGLHRAVLKRAVKTANVQVFFSTGNRGKERKNAFQPTSLHEAGQGWLQLPG